MMGVIERLRGRISRSQREKEKRGLKVVLYVEELLVVEEKRLPHRGDEPL